MSLLVLYTVTQAWRHTELQDEYESTAGESAEELKETALAAYDPNAARALGQNPLDGVLVVPGASDVFITPGYAEQTFAMSHIPDDEEVWPAESADPEDEASARKLLDQLNGELSQLQVNIQSTNAYISGFRENQYGGQIFAMRKSDHLLNRFNSDNAA